MLQDTCLMYDIPVKNVGGESTILLLSVQVFSPQIGETHINIAGIDSLPGSLFGLAVA